MYAALWRVLPGPLPVRILQATVLLVGVLALLAYVVFPWVDGIVSPSDVTLD